MHTFHEPAFYEQPARDVARALLGQRIVHIINEQRISGYLLETEAYDGESDGACHAHCGKTARNAPLYGPPGFSYVYFTYGLHWLLNVVARPENEPAGVLFRAIYPDEGLEIISANRGGQKRKNWCNGPAKLTRALAVDRKQNLSPLYDSKSPLHIEPGITVPDRLIRTSPRIGVDYAPEPWKSIEWRFFVNEKDFQSLLEEKK